MRSALSLSSIPGGAGIRGTVAWGRARHWVSLRVGKRQNSSFTGFLRLPTQFDALTRVVVPALVEREEDAALRIAVVGCANGAEAFTIASVLRARHPGLAFTINACDIEPACVEKARSARFAPDEVFNNQIITPEFVDSTFDRDGETLCVKREIAAPVVFRVADVLDDSFAGRAGRGTYDIVFAQNFLFHLQRRAAARALENIARLLRPRAAVFLDGTDIDLRRAVSRTQSWVPLDYEIERIHWEARRARAVGWPYHYWGLEPFQLDARDWRRRYATIFLTRGGEVAR